MQERTDLELVRQAKAGDKEAFSSLVERSEGQIKRLALRMTGSPEVAGELLQEAMLQAYLALPYLRKEASFKSWFYGIALNLIRAYRRETKPAALPLDTYEDSSRYLPWPDEDADPQRLAEKRELYQRVLLAIRQLSPRNRDAIRLYYFEELPLAEIGLALGISAGAVKGRLHKARQALKEQILLAYPELAGSAEQLPTARPLQVERTKPMVEVTVSDVMLKKSVDDAPYTVIILLDKSGDRLVPIWIGTHEGEQIAVALRKFTVVRPLTYSFVEKLLVATNAKLEEVRVESLKDEIFYGVVKLRVGESVQEVDARPSDAIALAVQVGCPIYVSEEVFAKAGIPSARLEETLGPDIQGIDSMLKDLEIRVKSRMSKLKIGTQSAEAEK